MKTKVLIFCFLIVSISSQTGHSQGENEEEKEYCNLIANPVKLRNEEGDDSSVIACQKMGTTIADSDEYQCCFESYRMLSTMTYACKWIKWRNEDEFNEEKDLLKHYNAKNITIKCDNASYNRLSLMSIALIAFLLF